MERIIFSNAFWGFAIMDIDIDMKTDFEPIKIFPNWTKASMRVNEEIRPHPCGVYAQNVAKNPLTQTAAVMYDVGEQLGLFKLDFLHNSVYNFFQSREEIDALLQIEPKWDILLIPSEQNKLFQLSKHGDILQKIRPRSVEEVADVLALIRPGKRDLVNMYINNKYTTRKLLYGKDKSGGYSFKKSHAIAYALVIVLQLHLIEMGAI